ncbi:MFS_MosC_like domain containing protein [Candidatus Nanopelagicaceae bacterium]|jgi:MFS family permease
MSQLRQYSRARIAITTAFIINGSMAGTFYSRIADIKEEFGISNSALGFALLVVSIGVLVGLGFSGKQSAKRGSAPVTFYATYALGASLLLVGAANNYITLCLTFLVLGACLATQDVAMNSHAIVLEHEADKRYMSTFHAMFSLGALGGGVVGGWFSQNNISLMEHVAFVAMLVFLANFSVRNMFLPATLDQHPLEGKKKIKKPKLFLIVGLLGLCAAVGEGSAGDWGAILARDTFDATPFVSTLPYICFSAAMVIGRLFGDRAASKYGPMNLIVGGGLIAGIGLGGGLLVGGIGGVIFGWLAAGIGLSTVIPMLFSQAGEIAKTRFEGQFAPSEGVAMVSGIAYFGFLVGPPTLGFLGDAVGLRWAMLVPAVLALVMALGSRPVLSNR